jgi:nitrite reductase (NADH) small subunit
LKRLPFSRIEIEGQKYMAQWIKIAPFEDIPKLGSRVVRTKDSEGKDIEIGVFKLEDDRVFAINNMCPHKGGPLSQGIVYGDKVACPLHSWKISLIDGKADEPDVGETACFDTRVEDGFVYLELKS